MPYRQSAVAQANEPTPSGGPRSSVRGSRRSSGELNPLGTGRELESAHELARELGWPSYRGMYQDLKQLDLAALEEQTSAFLRGTRRRYRESVEPHLRAQVGVGF